MTISRKKHSTQTKVKVVLAALKGEQTTAEITAKYGIHSTQINNWKKAALNTLPEVEVISIVDSAEVRCQQRQKPFLIAHGCC